MGKKLIIRILVICSVRLTVPVAMYAQSQEEEESLPSTGQSELHIQTEQHGADLNELDGAGQENDEQWQRMEGWRRRKLNLNTAAAETLSGLGLLSVMQVKAFLAYRQVLGPLVSIYELQAVPGFDLQLIRSLLPFVQAGADFEPGYHLKDRLQKGRHTLLLRYSRELGILPLSGVGASGGNTNKFVGSEDKAMLRYRYQLSRYISYGIVLEKDAGELWWQKKKQTGNKTFGPDHAGLHVFMQRVGNFKSIALGDFTVNMGQGLMQWHGLAFGKSGNVIQIKRESEVLRPYASPGEYYFFRGAGATWGKGRMEVTAFASARRLDGRVDSVKGYTSFGEETIAVVSPAPSGYHRTSHELLARGNVWQYTGGVVVKRFTGNGHAALNFIGHHYSRPLKKGEALYQLYNAAGQRMFNASVDHAFNWRNTHIFGEAAINDKFRPSLLQGMIMSVGARADIVLLYRYGHAAYRSMFSNAFGERGEGSNEQGLYMGCAFKWGNRWTVTAYTDIFSFPWLRYRISAPSNGMDALLSLQYKPDKTATLTCTYRYAVLPVDVSQNSIKERWIMQEKKHRVSVKASIPVYPKLLWSANAQAAASGIGAKGGNWLLYQQLQGQYKRWKAAVGYAWFETLEGEGVYISSLGFPGDNAISRFSGNGNQLHFRWQYSVNASCKIWLQLQQLLRSYHDKKIALDDINNTNEPMKIQCQFQYTW